MSYLRKEVIGNCHLYLGDCTQIMADMVGVELVDHIIYDPPYEADAHTKARRVLRKKMQRAAFSDGKIGGNRKTAAAPLPFNPITEKTRNDFARLAAQVCDGWVISFCQAEAVAAWRDSYDSAGIKWKRAGIWIKPDGQPQITGDRPGVGYESLAIGWADDRRSKWNGGGGHGIFTHTKSDPGYGHGGKANKHPTQKPLSLMAELVTLFTDPGDTVMDPFMGSGTTGVSCVRSGRRFIGMELDEGYFNAAVDRIRAAFAQPDLFIAPASPPPEQGGLL